MSPVVVLIGLPATGKTTTGRRLAALLGVDFADSDELLAQDVGRPVPEFLATQGEAAFRAAEAATVVRAMSDFAGVLALGGGAVTTAAVRDALAAAGTPVVLLEGSLATLARRVGDGRTRPLLAGDPAARLRKLAAAREPYHRECATLTVSTDNRDPDRVAAQIAALLSADESGADGGSADESSADE